MPEIFPELTEILLDFLSEFLHMAIPYKEKVQAKNQAVHAQGLGQGFWGGPSDCSQGAFWGGLGGWLPRPGLPQEILASGERPARMGACSGPAVGQGGWGGSMQGVKANLVARADLGSI